MPSMRSKTSSRDKAASISGSTVSETAKDQNKMIGALLGMRAGIDGLASHPQTLAKLGRRSEGIDIGRLIGLVGDADLIGIVAQLFQGQVLHRLATAEQQGQSDTDHTCRAAPNITKQTKHQNNHAPSKR